MMSRLPKTGPVRFLVNHWDALLSLALAFTFLILSLLRGEALLSVPAFAIAGIAGGFTLGTAAAAGGRWISDRIKDSDYGQLIRSIDDTESRFGRPYFIVAVAGYLTSAYSLIVALVEGATTGIPRILGVTVLILLSFYTLTGSISLLFLTKRHTSRISSLQALREKSERDARLRREGY